MLANPIGVGWGEQWETLATAINDYYGGGVGSAQYQQVVQMLNSGEYTMEEMETILGSIPEFNRTYNADGQLVGVSYNANVSTSTAAGNIAQEINSNVQNATTSQFKTVQNITKDAQTGKVTISDNVKQYHSGGTTTNVKAVAGSAIAAVLATSAGISAGKTLSSLLYHYHPDFFSDEYVSALDPNTWGNITIGDDSTGAKLFNYIFKIDPVTKNPQPYIDETTLAYMLAYIGSQGGLKEGFEQGETGLNPEVTPIKDPFNYVCYPFVSGATFPTNLAGRVGGVTGVGPFYCIRTPYDEYGYYSITIASQNPFYYGQTSASDTPALTYEHDGLTVYYGSIQFKTDINGSFLIVPASTTGAPDALAAWDMVFTGEITSVTGVEGITDQAGATQFDDSGITDYSDIAAFLLALQTQFPEWWENRIEVSPDGENVIKYIPVGFPTGGVGDQATTDGASQSQLAPDIMGDGENSTDKLIKTLIEIIEGTSPTGGMASDTTTPTTPADPNGNNTGTGQSPPFIIPVGSASALWKIYNPSQAQLDSFGAWLWSSDFVDQLLKLFNDPMQAIIGLHKVFCTPTTSGSGAIKVGYLSSGVNANYVSNQYKEIDCGSVNVKEYFKNVFDYSPFTKLHLYLPFIGFVDLNVSDVMRGVLGVKYTVDVLTGACLAEVSVTRDLNKSVLYTYSGNCAVQYPTSAGSYIGIITGLLGIAGGIAGTIASGGALAPMLMGAGASIGAMHTNIEHSGNLSGNAGAMGCKKPYLVIERPQTALPQYGEIIEGKPQNKTVILGMLTGHVRVKSARYDGFNCTANELLKIKNLLSNGIYI